MPDTVYRNALFFDGTGCHPVIADIAICGGRVAAIGPSLDWDENAVQVDCTGLWLMPGPVSYTHLTLPTKA